MDLSAQGCCHGILRKGERSGLVSSRVLSRNNEERRDLLKRRKGEKSGLVISRVLSRDSEEGEKNGLVSSKVVTGY